jgi:hypothetical protein
MAPNGGIGTERNPQPQLTDDSLLRLEIETAPEKIPSAD